MKLLDLSGGDAASLFTLYRMSAGRRLVIYSAILAELRPDEAALRARVEEAIAGDNLEAEQQKRWDASRSTLLTPEQTAMTALDLNVDRRVTGLFNVLDGAASAFGEDDPVGAGAGAMLTGLFRNGVAEHVNLSYADQVGPNSALVTIARDPQHAATVEALRLGPVIDAIEAANNALIVALRQAPAAVRWADVLATQVEGHERFLTVIASILAAYPGDAVAGRARRAALLKTVADQHNALRALYRRRVVPEGTPDDGGPVGETVEG